MKPARPGGQPDAAARPALRWRDTTFIDEACERLLVGQLCLHPERYAQLTIDADHLHGAPRTALGVFARLAEEDRLEAVPVSALGDAGIPAATVSAWIGEWTDAPVQLRELESRLEHLRRRRAIHTDAEALLAACVEPHASLEELEERLRGLATAAVSSNGRGTPWSHAIPAPVFVATEDDATTWLEPHLLARGAFTLVFAPRGIGKTHVGLSIAVRQAEMGRRVLLLDRDNPPRETRRRLRAWGVVPGREPATLRVLTRAQVPPLTDPAAWRTFPHDVDLVILDSLDSATEGVGEQDSAKPSRALAPLLDLAHRDQGPALLVLGNVIKSGEHSRGSGVVEDRADLVYEVRDATGLVPSGSKPWFQELPAAGAALFVERAARRKRRDRYRLAFLPSKCRLEAETEPFAWELDFRGTSWALTDVTETLLAEGEAKRVEVAAAKEHRLERAADALAELVAARVAEGRVLRKGTAEQTLVELHGLRREEARRVLQEGVGRRWRLEEIKGPGNPFAVLPVPREKWPAEIFPLLKTPVIPRPSTGGISAEADSAGRRKSG